ncbi:hypothetical protein AB1Y20_021447 [Prymnesium parvum]|uniref:Uncharacterized protein n=1 Tax=Prymnesium parvum TaxID=97485 RepID=A0AB34JJS8_PRYPA
MSRQRSGFSRPSSRSTLESAEQLQRLHAGAPRSGDAFRLSIQEFEEFCASRFGQLRRTPSAQTSRSSQWGGVPSVSSAHHIH